MLIYTDLFRLIPRVYLCSIRISSMISELLGGIDYDYYNCSTVREKREILTG